MNAITKALPSLKTMYEGEVKKVYWNIGEVASMLCITPMCLRGWLVQLDLDIRRSRRGIRQFVCSDVDYLMAVAPYMRKGKAELAKLIIQLKQK